MWHNENWMHKIFLTINKKVMVLFIGDSKGRKYFTTNKFHSKLSNSEFFQTTVVCFIQWLMHLPFVAICHGVNAYWNNKLIRSKGQVVNWSYMLTLNTQSIHCIAYSYKDYAAGLLITKALNILILFHISEQIRTKVLL